MKSILKKIRLPRKVMFIVAGVLLLSGASGAYALFMVQGTGDAEKVAPAASGLACTSIETLKMRRNGQRWIRKYITVEKGSGEERVRTALRVAGLLVHAEKADLYQVAVLDATGPKERADWRGPAIGAQVLFAPDPKIVPGMNNLFSARYSDAEANMVGLYYGQEVSLSQDQIKDTLTSIIEKTECADPPLPEGAEGGEAGGHGEASGEAKGHGEATEGGHGEAPESVHDEAGEHGAAEAEGHGEEAGAEASESHGEKVAEGHGEEATSEGHGADEGGEKSEGILASITGMIFASSEETPEAAEHAPAEGHEAPVSEEHGETPSEDHSSTKPEGHGKAAVEAEDHAEKPAERHGEEAAAGDHGEAETAEKSEGILASITGMIFGSSEETPAEGHETPAAEAHGEDAAKPADASEAHSTVDENGAGEDHDAAAAPEHQASESHEPAEAAADSEPHVADEAKPAEHSDAGEHAAEPTADAHALTAEAETKKEPAAH